MKTVQHDKAVTTAAEVFQKAVHTYYQLQHVQEVKIGKLHWH